jgi:hypothetical protein
MVDRQETWLRRVRLWGAEVVIDDRGDVLCAGCMRLIDIEQLAVDLFGRPVDVDSDLPTINHRPQHRLELPLGYWSWSIDTRHTDRRSPQGATFKKFDPTPFQDPRGTVFFPPRGDE